jgi:para-nitrobenzyl esterase
MFSREESTALRQNQEGAPIVSIVAHTEAGDLRGVDENGVAVFRGVPYAAPPIGARRFAPPVLAESWSGVRDADRGGPIAPQGPSRLRDAMGDFTAEQSEDCLTLTIWTPGLDVARPVMMWLHGGAWSSGAGSLAWYDGALLAREQGIVVVGVNYRLGALGYLHAEGISPGNLGTMDQVAALRWVHGNISAFGGDAGQVTLVGQSAGAASIGLLIGDATARPMFHRAILQSGGFGRAPLRRSEAAAIGAEFVFALGIDPLASDAAKRMRAVPVSELVAAQGALARARARFADTTPPFMPLVEDGAPDPIAVIADAACGMPLMVGTTRDEVHAFFAANPAMANPAADAVSERFAALAGGADAIARYRERRPGGSVMDLLADLGTDHTFCFPTLRLADASAARGSPAYAYRFDYAPPRSRFKACHCIELPFMFGTLDAWADAPMLAGGDPRAMTALSAIMRDHWGRFVRDGAPGADWPRYQPAHRMTMIFDAVTGPVSDPSGMGWRA